jgi:hypothetical protein
VSGLLAVVGTGIKAVGHLTADARAWITSADEVHYVAADPLTEATIRGLAPRAQSLSRFYAVGKARHETYEAMTQSLLAPVRAGRTVCAAFYGHPGVFVYPSHDAIRRARAEGLRAIMEPGVSAEDCLFADLGFDPAVVGCAQYEVTDFLVYRRRPDPSAAMILWQIGVVGDLTWNPGRTNADNLRVLVAELAPLYGDDHVVVVYEAPQLPTCAPRIDHVRLADLPRHAADHRVDAVRAAARASGRRPRDGAPARPRPAAVRTRRTPMSLDRLAAIHAPPPIAPIRTREDLIDALGRAAELEHAIMAQYLYAAFSLDVTAPGCRRPTARPSAAS